MRILFFTLTILLCSDCVRAQENPANLNVSARNPFSNYKIETGEKLTASDAYSPEANEPVAEETAQSAVSSGNEFNRKKQAFVFGFGEYKRRAEEKDADDTNTETGEKDTAEQENPYQIPVEEKFHWKPALAQSGIFLGIQHGYRIARQKRTRDALGGPFFRDWARSVKNLRGWRDGDKSTINYIGHPLQGGLTGRIFVNNSDAAKKQEFSKSKAYWTSRFKAMAWTAAWSAQFELGPVSEATIGNVGLQKKNGYSTMAYVDLVVTPTLGTGVLIGEDAIDKYFLKNWLERKSDNKMKIKILRSLLTPTTSFSNLLRGKMPWKRDARPL